MPRKEDTDVASERCIGFPPHMVIHLDVGRSSSIEALEKAMLGDSKIFLVAQKDAKIDLPEPEDIYTVGTVSRIKQMIKLPGGGSSAFWLKAYNGGAK